jgi:hypothetical protein
MKDRALDPRTLWRLPAGLSSVALATLLCWPFLPDAPSGSPAREALAAVLAVGTCCMLLGVGLGLWIAMRVRTRRTLMAAVWGVIVAAVWWWVVYGPLLSGSLAL